VYTDDIDMHDVTEANPYNDMMSKNMTGLQKLVSLLHVSTHHNENKRTNLEKKNEIFKNKKNSTFSSNGNENENLEKILDELQRKVLYAISSSIRGNTGNNIHINEYINILIYMYMHIYICIHIYTYKCILFIDFIFGLIWLVRMEYRFCNTRNTLLSKHHLHIHMYIYIYIHDYVYIKRNININTDIQESLLKITKNEVYSVSDYNWSVVDNNESQNRDDYNNNNDDPIFLTYLNETSMISSTRDIVSYEIERKIWTIIADMIEEAVYIRGIYNYIHSHINIYM
jgi:hypothetical protein